MNVTEEPGPWAPVVFRGPRVDRWTHTNRLPPHQRTDLPPDERGEITAYSSTITKEGRTVGTVRNDGRGGADLPRFNTATDRTDYADKATHPEETTPWEAEESLCGHLLTHALMARQLDTEKGTAYQKPEDGDWLETLKFRVSRRPRDVVTAALHRAGGDASGTARQATSSRSTEQRRHYR